MDFITVNNVVTNEEKRNWDYKKSISKASDLYNIRFRKASIELLDELYQAKKHLNKGPGNPHSDRLTWSGFVAEAFPHGPTYKTVTGWVRKYEIGDDQWYSDIEEKKKNKKDFLTPKPLDLSPTTIKKVEDNGDGTVTIYTLIAKYPDKIFKQTVKKS